MILEKCVYEVSFNMIINNFSTEQCVVQNYRLVVVILIFIILTPIELEVDLMVLHWALQ